MSCSRRARAVTASTSRSRGGSAARLTFRGRSGLGLALARGGFVSASAPFDAEQTEAEPELARLDSTLDNRARVFQAKRGELLPKAKYLEVQLLTIQLQGRHQIL